MPKFEKATTFSLYSVDHDQVLLDAEVHSTRRVLTDESATPPKQMKLAFSLNGVDREALLTRERGAFAADATVTVMNEAGEYESRALEEEHFAYYSEDRNWVLTFHGDSKFDGLIYEDNNNKIHHFVVENGEMRVDGNVRDYFPGEFKAAGRKLTSEANGIDYWDDCHPAQANGMSEMRIGVAIGNVMFKNFGQQGSIAEQNSYITLSNTIYERQMDVSLVVADTFIATSAGVASWAVGSCTKSIQTQLNDMRFWNPPSDQVLWHLLDDCFGFSGGTLGIAYLGVLCGNNNVGVSLYSDDVYSSTQYPTWATVAHEIGHNFDAQHSFEEGQGRTGGIMDYGYLSGKLINGEVQFNSKYREFEVCREVTSAANRGCLVPALAQTTTTVSTAEEVGVFAAKRRDLKCFKHAHRVPTTATNVKRYFNVNRRQCWEACADRENCSGFVFDRNGGWCELVGTDVDPEALEFSSNFNTFLCAEGQLPEKFTRKSEDDVLDEANVGQLKSECCAVSAHETFLGMNSMYRDNMTQEQCEAECVQNTKCEAVTFDPVRKDCMFYGGKDFSHQITSLTGASTLSCDRACISALAVDSSSEASAVMNYGGVVGGFALVAGLIAAVVGVAKWRKQRKADQETVVAPSSTDGAVYKATL